MWLHPGAVDDNENRIVHRVFPLVPLADDKWGLKFCAAALRLASLLGIVLGTEKEALIDWCALLARLASAAAAKLLFWDIRVNLMLKRILKLITNELSIYCVFQTNE